MCGGGGYPQEAAEHHHNVGRRHHHKAQGGGHGGDLGAHRLDDSLAKQDQANLGGVRLDREQEKQMLRQQDQMQSSTLAQRSRKRNRGMRATEYAEGKR